jgi:TolB-like protein
LKEGNLSVSEVAYSTGFSSPSYFNKCFHEQYGFPPGDIHKQKIAEIDQRNIFSSLESTDSGTVKKGDAKIRRLYVFGFVLLVALLLTIAYYYLINPATKSQIQEKSIAVLPFKNFSDNQANQYISDGMMEAILSNISKIGDLRVISRTSVEKYRGSLKSAKQIGEELEVNHILEGSTFQDNQNVRITVQLIDTKTDEHIWSESYDSELENIFYVQNQIAREIANALHSQITADELTRIERIPTSSTKAYELYQKALFYYINYQQQRQEQDYHTCKHLLSMAMKEDSTYADAYTKLADLYWIRNYRSEYYSETFMDTVYQLCQKALTFDLNSSDAHRLLGQYYLETGKRDSGIRELETSISINRNNASAYEVLGFYHNWLGNWETGIPYLLKSIKLDPYSIFVPYRYGYLARAYLDLLDFDKTFLYSQRAIELGSGRKPALRFAYWVNTHTHLVLGNAEEAINAANKMSEFSEIGSLRMKAEVYCHLFRDFEKGIQNYHGLRKINPYHFNYRHRYAYALWETGKKDTAMLLFEAQIRECEKELELGRIERNDPYYDLAGIYAFLKEYDKALGHLRKHRFTSGLEIYAENDPLFRDLHDNQEFKRIIQNAKDEKELLRNKIEKTIAENSEL